MTCCSGRCPPSACRAAIASVEWRVSCTAPGITLLCKPSLAASASERGYASAMRCHACLCTAVLGLKYPSVRLKLGRVSVVCNWSTTHLGHPRLFWACWSKEVLLALADTSGAR